MVLRGMDTLSRKTTQSNLFCLPSEKGSSLNGSKFLPFRLDPFQKEFGLLESKQEITDVVSLIKNSRKSTNIIKSP